VMGCYGIGISRTLQACIEQSHDPDGILWPWSIAPFQVLICLLDPKNEEARQLAQTAGLAAEAAGADVLVDDRDERPGVKFKDADLIGIPLRLTIGAKGLKEGIVELKRRNSKEVAKLPVAELEQQVRAAVGQMR
jgi:prolyl-tRNA synthetase